MTTETTEPTVQPEQPQEVTLTKEQQEELLKRAGNLACLACPYFESYTVDVKMGFVGRCHALYALGERKGGLRGRLMKFLSRYMWTMIVDNCSYQRRYERLLEKLEKEKETAK